jgi:iron complex transport system ATP-binding protein
VKTSQYSCQTLPDPIKIIEIKSITVFRGDTQVFTDLSLDISQGCHTAILGPNGAGKSTLLKLLSGELYPVWREGSHVRLFGQERWNVWELRAKLGIVSHDLQHEYLGHVPGINVLLSGYYAIIDTYAHQQFSAADLERAGQIMDMLGVSSLKDRLFGEMSTGEQRRFLLGRALINDPSTLVLDEPTSGLDLYACFHYLEIVRRLMRQGKTVILVTHHIHEIPPEVSRVILLKRGEVIADGPKQELLTSEKLTNLFDTPVALVQANGFYQAMPGRGNGAHLARLS